MERTSIDQSLDKTDTHDEVSVGWTGFSQM